MDNNNMNKKLTSGMGYARRFPAVCVADLPEEAAEDILRILKELDGMIEAKHQEKCPGCEEAADKRNPDAKPKEKPAIPDEDSLFMDMALSGDGEEVFGKMLDDLVYMFQLASALYSTLYYLADNRMSRERALRSGIDLMEEADSVLEEWQRYSMTEE